MLRQVLQKVSLILFLVCSYGLLNYLLAIQQVRPRFLLTDPVCGNDLPWLRSWGSPVANTVRRRDG